MNLSKIKLGPQIFQKLFTYIEEDLQMFDREHVGLRLSEALKPNIGKYGRK